MGIHRLILTTLLLVTLPITATATPQAEDDVLIVITDQPLLILGATLLANDSTTDQATIEITDWPDHGQLQVDYQSSKETLFRYTPDLELGWDYFDYRLLSSDGASGHARVSIRLSPPKMPLAGRWPTPSCKPDNCPATGAMGQGEEIGWYHAASATFELCDWVVDHLTGCQSLPVPNTIPAVGWTPLVGDWDNDGWDGVGVYDPVTGALHTFEIAVDDAEQGSLDHLVPFANVIVGEPGDLAVVGSWDSDGIDRIGLFRDAEDLFRLETAAQTVDITFGHFAQQQEPLIGDWLLTGSEQLGLWDTGGSVLLLRDALTSSGVKSFQAVHRETGQIATGLPFVGRWTTGSKSGKGDFLGLYDAEKALLQLFTVHCDGCGTLPLQVPVDP